MSLSVMIVIGIPYKKQQYHKQLNPKSRGYNCVRGYHTSILPTKETRDKLQGKKKYHGNVDEGKQSINCSRHIMDARVSVMPEKWVIILLSLEISKR